MSLPLSGWWEPRWAQEAYDWQQDAREGLAWLYGDPGARTEANAPDLAAWRALGKRRAA